MHTVYKISADDQDVVEEFNAKPIGHHSPGFTARAERHSRPTGSG